MRFISYTYHFIIFRTIKILIFLIKICHFIKISNLNNSLYFFIFFGFSEKIKRSHFFLNLKILYKTQNIIYDIIIEFIE